MKKQKKLYCKLILVIVCMLSLTANANSGPVVVEENPGLTIIPMGETELWIESEHLVIDMSQDGPYTAKIEAFYQMKNPTTDRISQTMLFPFVTEPLRTQYETIEIIANEKEVSYEVLRLADLPMSHHRFHEDEWHDRVYEEIRAFDWHHLTAIAGENDLDPQHYNLMDEVTVYTFEMIRKDESYEATVSFDYEADNQIIIAAGFNGMAHESQRRITWSRWIHEKSGKDQSDTARIIILGEPPDIENLVVTEETIVDVEQLSLETVLNQAFASLHQSDHLIQHPFFGQYMISRLDQLIGRSNTVISLEWDILEVYYGTSYIGAVLYTVDFEPESQLEMIVRYDLRAGQDRSNTSRYAAFVAYLLSPAAEWKHFQNLTIQLIPHEDQPYLLNSTLPLHYNATSGMYENDFEELPDNDLLFRMYHRSEPESGFIKTFNNPYILLLVVPVALVIAVLGVVAAVVLFALKKNNMNLRD